MVMLGAQLDDLQALTARLDAMSTDVTATRDNSVATSTQLVNDVTTASTTGLQQINGLLEQLRASVEGAVSSAESTQWTGANADRFRQGAIEFQAAIAAGDAATRDAFTTFQTSAAAMSDALQEFVTGFSAALTDASASATDMARAVEAQRANLDSVMNLGLSFN